jgi:hypothetical protein
VRSKLQGRPPKAKTGQGKEGRARPIETTRRHFTGSNSTRQQKWLDGEPTTGSSRSLISAASAKVPDARTRQPSVPQIPPVPSLSGLSLIADLCHAIQQPVSVSLGYLIDQGNKHYQVFATDRSISNPERQTAMSLKELLDGDPLRFPPRKRAFVATILASSLLQLQRTHWLKDNWSKRDIFFVAKDNTILFEQPYLSQDFVSTRPPSSSTPAEKTGVMQAMPSFHPKISLECLGIVLIELCFGMSIERLENKVRLKPLGPSDQPNHEFCLAIAHALTWEEISEHDSLFSDPIISCLHFPNMRRAKQGQHDEVIDDMYSLIVKPLHDEMTRRWPPRFDPSIHV